MKRKDMINDLVETGIPFDYITCDFCKKNSECEYAWDFFNTDGDCLLGDPCLELPT